MFFGVREDTKFLRSSRLHKTAWKFYNENYPNWAYVWSTKGKYLVIRWLYDNSWDEIGTFQTKEKAHVAAEEHLLKRVAKEWSQAPEILKGKRQ